MALKHGHDANHTGMRGYCPRIWQAIKVMVEMPRSCS
jgi:hypothetical protein